MINRVQTKKKMALAIIIVAVTCYTLLLVSVHCAEGAYESQSLFIYKGDMLIEENEGNDIHWRQLYYVLGKVETAGFFSILPIVFPIIKAVIKKDFGVVHEELTNFYTIILSLFMSLGIAMYILYYALFYDSVIYTSMHTPATNVSGGVLTYMQVVSLPLFTVSVAAASYFAFIIAIIVHKLSKERQPTVCKEKEFQ